MAEKVFSGDIRTMHHLTADGMTVVSDVKITGIVGGHKNRIIFYLTPDKRVVGASVLGISHGLSIEEARDGVRYRNLRKSIL